MFVFARLFTILLTGYIVLAGAILLNMLSSAVQILSWYDYLNNLLHDGSESVHQQIRMIDLAYLYLIYPFMLGLLAITGNRVVRKLIKRMLN